MKVTNSIIKKPQPRQTLLNYVFSTLEKQQQPETISLFIIPELILNQYLRFLIKTVIIYYILNFA